MKAPRIPWKVFLPRACAAALVVFGITTALTHAFSLGLDPQTETSTGRRLFVINHLDNVPQLGGYVAFRSDERVAPFFKPGTIFVKKVVGMAGDGVALHGREVRVAGFSIGDLNPRIERKIHDLQGDRFRVTYSAAPVRIPAGHIFVANESVNSFDSRYFGPLPMDQIVGVAYAAF